MLGNTVLPAVEGGFASRNPATSLLAGPGQLVAGAAGVIVGRFGWADLTTNLVANTRANAQQRLGFVLPIWGTWERLYSANRTWILRAGMALTLASRGEFWARFVAGANAGLPVFANPADGSAAMGNPGGYEPTQFTIACACVPGGLAVISTWGTFAS